MVVFLCLQKMRTHTRCCLRCLERQRSDAPSLKNRYQNPSYNGIWKISSTSSTHRSVKTRYGWVIKSALVAHISVSANCKFSRWTQAGDVIDHQGVATRTLGGRLKHSFMTVFRPISIKNTHCFVFFSLTRCTKIKIDIFKQNCCSKD